MWRAVLLGVVTVSCQHAAKPPLASAGDPSDEGHGELARASAHLLTSEETKTPPPTPAPRRYEDDVYTDASAYGSGTYGGATYASYTPPPWNYPYISRAPAYTPRADLTGAIEGTISWQGAVTTLTTACGAIETVHVGRAHGLSGAVVYIERLLVGRAPINPGEQRPATVGGVVVKRGCALLPTAQIIAPVPAQLTIHGDAKAARLRVGDRPIAELQEGGRIALQASAGETRIESEDGTLAAAWVLGLTTPAYAIADDAGHFRIDELASGSYDVTIWAPPVPTLKAGKLVYGAPTITRRTIKVADKKAARMDVTLK